MAETCQKTVQVPGVTVAVSEARLSEGGAAVESDCRLSMERVRPWLSRRCRQLRPVTTVTRAESECSRDEILEWMQWTSESGRPGCMRAACTEPAE